MQEQLDNEKANTRKLKQEYLISRIIKENHDPEAFTEFLGNRKPHGEDIDNWTLDELETEVLIFKRGKQEQGVDLLESIELNQGDKCTYASRFNTAKKKKNVVGQNKAKPLIESVEVKDGGLFSGRYIQFNIHTPQLDLRVQRTEGEFRWLSEGLKKEFPFTTVPPLVKIDTRGFDDASLELKCRQFQRFLHDCVTHPGIRNSLILEIFLTSPNKNDFTIKMKEIHKYLARSVLIDKNLSKKRADNLADNPIEVYPTTAGVADCKITPLLKTHLQVSQEQITKYESSLEALERCSQEFDKCFSRLIDLHEEVQDIYKDLQTKSSYYNENKPRKDVWNLLEEQVFSTLENHFGQLCELISSNHTRSTNHLQTVLRRLYKVPEGLRNPCQGDAQRPQLHIRGVLQS